MKLSMAILTAGWLLTSLGGVRAEPAGTIPQLELQAGHAAAVTALAYAPSSNLLASASQDQTVKLWDTASGELRHTLSGHTAAVVALAFSADGTTLFSGSRDGEVRQWHVATGAAWPAPPVLKFAGLTADNNPTAVALASGGETLALGLADKRIGLAGPGVPVGANVVDGHDKNIRSLVFAPDGKVLASGSDDGRVKLWRWSTGLLKGTIVGHAMPIYGLAFSPDGKTLGISSEDGQVTLWDVATRKRLQGLWSGRVGDTVSAVAFSPDNAKVAAVGYYGLKVWNAQTGVEVLDRPGGGMGSAVAFAPAGGGFAVGRRDGTLQLWSGDGKSVRTLGRPDPVLAVAWSPDGKLMAAGGSDRTVRLWNASTGELVRTFAGHTGAVRAVAFSPDGSLLASGSADKTARLWNTREGNLLRALSGSPAAVNAVAFSPDGKTLATGCGGGTERDVRLWSVSDGKLVRTLVQNSGTVNAVAFSPDGALVAAGSGDWSGGELTMWAVSDGKLLVREYGRAVRSVAFSPDSEYLAAGTTTLNEQNEPIGDSIRLLAVEACEIARTMAAATPGGWVTSLAFSPDGKTLVTGSRDKALRLWDVRKGECRAAFTGHVNAATGVAFAPDGAQLVSAGQDCTLRRWNVADGRLLATLVTLPPAPHQSFSRDWLVHTPAGYYNASAGADRYIRFRMGGAVVPAEAWQTRYQRPDLVALMLTGQAVPDPAALKGPTPPMLTFTTPRNGDKVTGDTVTVALEAADDSGVQAGLTLLVNGARVAVEPAAGGVADGAATRTRTFSLPVTLPAGGTTIRLQAIATDDDGLQSPRAELWLQRDAKVARGSGSAPLRAAATGRLLGLCVGVSKYDDARMNLNFADRDAQELAREFAKQRGLYEKAEVTALVNTAATRFGVTAALDKLVARAGRDDTAIVMLAGHGWRAADGSFYFATHDVNFAQVETTALPWRTVVDRLTQLSQKCRRVIVLLDACHSGSAATNEDLVRAVLNAHAGVMIFASSRGNELSLEGSDYKHGVFTYAMLEAAGGKAALKQKKEVPLRKFIDYVQDRVAELSDDGQHPQVPFLQDFDTDAAVVTAP